ncbi:hypothetical protein ACA910_017557 [Epithemia clementina (nom. ined.)]
MGQLPANNPFHAVIGDWAHVATVASTVAFALMVTKFARDERDTLFDKEWKENGFCITNPEVPYWNSHDLCLYVDTASAILLALVYFALHKTPGLEQANELLAPAMMGIFAHGVGHGYISFELRGNMGTRTGDNDKTGDGSVQDLTPSEIILRFLPGVAFWLCLIKPAAPNFDLIPVAALAAAAQLGFMAIPSYFGFTYVQTLLLFIFSLNQLARKRDEKDFTYAVYAMLGPAVTLVGWMESTKCTAFVKDKLYGHLVYDAFPPIFILGWYLTCYAKISYGENATKTMKKEKAL